jgi:hypothetical protein
MAKEMIFNLLLAYFLPFVLVLGGGGALCWVILHPRLKQALADRKEMQGKLAAARIKYAHVELELAKKGISLEFVAEQKIPAHIKVKVR